VRGELRRQASREDAIGQLGRQRDHLRTVDVIGKVTPTSLSAVSRRPLSAWSRGPADSHGEDDDNA
jgi:hypothetical protein